MDTNMDEFLRNVAQQSEARTETMDRLLAAADSSKVFGQPTTSGDQTVITAAEIAAGGGFGSGMGVGMMQESPGGGGGGGGGGGSMGRPVAVITVTPSGVQVKPILDMTKILITGLTALAGLMIVAAKMRRR
jgi:uncharacterized spore protein YtfJ